jgi:hypothetical protein
MIYVGKLKLSLMLLLMFLFCMLVLLVAFRPVAHANPAIFSDGFESGDFSAWTGTSIPTGSTVETVTSPVHQGSYAAHIVRPLDLDVHPNIYKDFSTVSTAYARFYVRFGSLPSSNGAIYYPAYFGMSEYPTYVTEISAYNNDGTVYWRIGMPDDDANWYFNVSSSTVSVDTWYCVEIKKVGASSNGESRLYVDGVEVASVTGKNTGTKGQCNELSFWADSSGAGLLQIDTYFDSVIIDSSYIGPQYQVSFSQTGLTSDAGSNTVLTVGTTNYTYANLPVNNIWVDSGTTFHWSTDISGGAGKQFVETGDSGLTSPIMASGTSSATYKTQYYLTVTSAHDTAGGAGWYDSSSTAYATLTDGTVSGGAGTQYVFTSWGTDASGTSYAQSDAITMDGPKTALANWKTQYTLTMAANFGTTSPVAGDHWYDAGSLVTISAAAPSAGAGERYVWVGWAGTGTVSYTGTDNPATDAVTMDGPVTESSSWTHQYYLTVDNGGHGTIGGEGWYDANVNAQATITPLTVAGTTGTQYVFAGWSGDATGSGSPSNDILMDGPKTATGGWKTQYLLYVITDPTGLSPQPIRNPLGQAGPTNGWWYDASTSVTVTAQASSGHVFDHWDVDGATQGNGVNPVIISMGGSHTAIAYYLKEAYLVVRGAHDEIFYRIYNSSIASWENWNVLPGSTIDSPAATMCGNELHVVVRGINNDEIWHGYVNLTDETFSGWTLLSGNTPSVPTLTSNGTTLCLVVQGETNIICYRFYDVASHTWSDWTGLPGGLTYTSPAATLLNGTLQVVVRGINYDQIWHCYVNLTDDTFSGWTLLSGATPSTPTLTANSTTLCLVVRGETNCIYYRFYDVASKVWGDWTPFPSYATPDNPTSGATIDGPAATMLKDTLRVVVRGINNDEIWHGYVNLTDNSFSGWTQLSGSTRNKPTLTS